MTTVLRLERSPAGAPADGTFAALGARLDGVPDADPVPAHGERWLAWRGAEPVARLGASLASDLAGAPGVSGVVGHFAAADADAGVALLRAACDALAQHGAARVLGPMNGNTWHRYRLALPHEPGEPVFDPPVFLTEPRNPAEYVACFTAAGFEPVAWYESRIEEPIVRRDDRTRREALRARGITLDTLGGMAFDDALETLWRVSLASFADNPYYSPIALDEFRALYAPIRTRIDARFVLLARDVGGDVAGFMLGFPDLLSDRGAGPTRMIAKTIAVVPRARGLGLGAVLLAELRNRAADAGYAAVIDALIHASNVSRHMSEGHGTQRFRRYALFQWTP